MSRRYHFGAPPPVELDPVLGVFREFWGDWEFGELGVMGDIGEFIGVFEGVIFG